MQNQSKFQPRPGGFGKISARRNDTSSPTDFSRQTKVRPLTPDSLLSEEDIKMTKEQHPCSQNLGMAAAFLLPIAMVRKIRVYPSVFGCIALNRKLFNSVLRPFQDYFSLNETGQSVGGAKTGEPREKNT